MRLLLVEDARLIREPLSRALELTGWEVEAVPDGEAALARLAVAPVDAVVLDIMLPGKDGLIHISELAEGRTVKTEDVVSVGDVVTAKCIGIDDKGRVKMSIRAALRDAKAAEAEAAGITE